MKIYIIIFYVCFSEFPPSYVFAQKTTAQVHCEKYCVKKVECSPPACMECKANFLGPQCEACITGKYGPLCQKNCNCIHNYACDKETGSCRHYGCDLHWSGDNKCDKKHDCRRGFYGRQCFSCGQCKLACKNPYEVCFPDCNRTSGGCATLQCKQHFTGWRCDTCVRLRYGLNCQYKCGQCFNDVCHESNGVCPQGCKSGYMGKKCDIPCKKGRYGYQCLQKCGQCAGDVQCSYSTGECPGLNCLDGYGGEKCDQPTKPGCPVGQFGENCKEACGFCAKHATCNQIDGTCEKGCLNRYKPPFCFTCSSGFFGKICDETCGHCKFKEVCDGLSGACPYGCAEGFTGYHCKQRIRKIKTEELETSDLLNFDDL